MLHGINLRKLVLISPLKKQGSGYYIYLIVRFNENFPQMSLSFNAELDAPGGEQRFRDYDIMIKDPYKNLQGESHNEYYEIKNSFA